MAMLLLICKGCTLVLKDKIRHAPHTLSSEHAFKTLDIWPDLYVCIHHSHACYVCMWTVTESDCMSQAGWLQELHRVKRQQKITACGVASEEKPVGEVHEASLWSIRDVQLEASVKVIHIGVSL